MNNDKLELALERFVRRFEEFNTKVLEEFGKTISKFDGLSATQAHKLAQQMKNGRDIDKILADLERISKLSRKDIEDLLEITAKENIAFANTYYEAKAMDKVSYETSKQFQDIVKAVEKTTKGEFTNLSKTTALKLLKDNGKPLYLDIKKAYNEVIDRCVLAVATGQTNYQKAMYDTIKQLSNSGVKKIFYDNEGKRAYARRLDSSVRQNILEGVRQVNIGVQEQVGKEFGADGVEVSHHVNCAPDHIHIDGQQFSKKKFEKINNNLTRPVASMNCRHFVFSIVLGVSSPLYTKKQLEEDRKNNEKGFEYEGKHYTLYEGEQLQRKIELAVRQQKDLQIIAKASNDKDTISKSQSNITQLTQKYKELSKISGLPTKMDRMRVVGYQRVNVNKLK